MKAHIVLLSILAFIQIEIHAQSAGDYRSAGTGTWNLPGTWERFDGAIWQPNPTPPSNADGVITILNMHNVTVSTAVTADQIVVDAGGTLTVSFALTLTDGAGTDLLVNGTLANTGTLDGAGSIVVNNSFALQGTIQGAGALTVNGNTTWSSGTLARSFTNQATRTLTLSTSNAKNLNAALVNDGIMIWDDGFLIPIVVFGASVTNNGTFTINSNTLFQDNGGVGVFNNTGTITKTSAGTTSFNNLATTNTGTINLNAGTLSLQNGSFTNTGTLSLTAATITNNSATFNHNTGSVIQGSGSFTNGGTLNLNIDLTFPAAIAFSSSGTIQGDGNLVVNNDFALSGTIQGNGTLTVNGNTTWTSGTLDRTFTNQIGRMLVISTSNSKSLAAPLTNNGTMDWQDGTFIPLFSSGGTLTNNSTFTISGNNLYQDNSGIGTLSNTGTITKTSVGTTTWNNVTMTNSGTINYTGAVTHGSNGSFTNTGTVTLNSTTFTNNVTFNHNTGSVIQGSGSFTNGGTLNLNIDLTFPAAITFSNSGTVQGDGNLVVNNDFALSGTIQGNGSLTVNGNTTWTSGTLDRTFTNQIGRMLIISTSGVKTLSAPLTNNGTMDWQDGTFIPLFSNGGTLTNNSAFTISGNNLYQDNSGIGMLNNTGTITKTSVGTTTWNNVAMTNSGTINYTGAVTHGSNGSFTNAGTLTLNSTTFTNNVTFNHNTGSVIQGSGSFANGGTLNLNIDLTFPAAITFSNSGTVQGDGNLVVNNDFALSGTIQGNGSLTVNGNTTWTNGILDRTFTNQIGRMLIISTSGVKTLSAPLTNNGTMDWQDGTFIPLFSNGGTLTNNSTFTISGNNLYQDNSGVGTLINTGTITKTSLGSTTWNNVAMSNSGTINYTGAVTHGSNGSFTNTGTVTLNSTTLTNNVTFNHNTGSVIQGSGSFANGGTLNLNIDLTFSAALTFSNSGTTQGAGNLTVNDNFTLQGTIQGAGSLTVNGNTTWSGGILGRAFTNQATRTLTLSTTNSKNLNASLVNDGTMVWEDGFFIPIITAGGTFTNNGLFTINSNTLYQDNSGVGSLTNNGTIAKTSTGTTTINNINFNNQANGVLKGVGTISFGSGSLTNNGSIDPGLSPGLMTIENRQIFSENSTLNIEVESNNGPGMGHDQVVSNVNNLNLNGALNISLINNFQPAGGSQYTILTYPSRLDTFDLVSPCWEITYNPTSTVITYNPVTIGNCPGDITMDNASGTCGRVVDYMVTAIGTPAPELNYQFSGATSGSGLGTGTGEMFNVGQTFVTITASNGCSMDGCTFTITIHDIDAPMITCPGNLTVNNDPGVCGAAVTVSANATDNCGIASVVLNPPSGLFSIGTTQVTATATDVNGLTASCTFAVTVVDAEPPTLDCPNDITVNTDPGSCDAVVNYSIPTNDNCPGASLLQIIGLPSGASFPLGTTVNTFRVTDVAGNSTTCSFSITVEDNTGPMIDCPDDITASNDPGTCSAVVSYSVNVSDNCSGASVLQIEGLPSGDAFPIGSTVNVFRATDTEGNSTTCSFTVTVSDNELPSIECPDDITVVQGTPVVYSVNTSDNCPGEAVLQIQGLPSGSMFPVGNTTNVFRVTDVSGNSATCAFVVTVIEDSTCNPPIGTPCDDGDPCTANDVIGADCNCAGVLLDSDGDGTPDCNDGCPADPNKVDPGICGCGVSDIDSDSDGTADCLDGCPDDPDKVDPGICGCGVSDADSDGDGTADCNDGCPDDPNKTVPGMCGCGIADTDSDGDGTADCNDGCPNDPNKIAPGMCGCGIADTDSDGDGTADCNDGCPNDPNKTTPGICGCGVSDIDTDMDGTADCNDGCPNDPNKIAPGICGCGVSDIDTDMDGTADCNDGCPNDPNKIAPGICGCGVPDVDTDMDGTADCNDGCPNDPNKTAPGMCGCGVADTDSDMDGTADCNDGCPFDPNKTAPGICGCGTPDTDSDGDGTPNCNDGCPNDPNKTAPGNCGCGNPEPGAVCNDGNPNTINDIIGSNCICAGTPVGPNTCTDGIMNGNETGIDCGGSCGPCAPPTAVCGIFTVYVNPNSPVYDGPGNNNVWWIPAADLNAGSVSSSPMAQLKVMRYLSSIPFNWTTNGACIDATPNAVLNSNDLGTVYKSCLPVANLDFNSWKTYKLKISDPFGSAECVGKYRIVPQVPTTLQSAPTVLHYVLADELTSDAVIHAFEENDVEALPPVESSPVQSELTLVPNPGTDFLEIQFGSTGYSPVRISILDISGQRVSDGMYNATPGLNHFVFDMAAFASGIYVVRVQSDTTLQCSKWIKD